MMKSYKREISAALIILWASFAISIMWFTDGADMVTARGNVLSGITPFILIPALTMFGLHSIVNKDKE